VKAENEAKRLSYKRPTPNERRARRNEWGRKGGPSRKTEDVLLNRGGEGRRQAAIGSSGTWKKSAIGGRSQRGKSNGLS